MNKTTSVYLDACRLLMALVVMVGHLSGQRLTGGLFWQLEPYTVEAVSVFFVLSGFVIGYVTDARPGTATSYALARSARIYSVAVPALLLTFALDALGRHADPALYSAAWGYDWHGRALQFLSGLLFLNRIWGVDINQGSDLSYWSLGCEVWYYALFGLTVFAPHRWRMFGIGAVLAFIGPGTALLYPLWLLGVRGYRICQSSRLGPRAGVALAAGSVALWAIYEATVPLHGRFTRFVPPVLDRDLLIQDYIIGALFTLHIIGVHAASKHFAPVAPGLTRPVRWAAGATFSIYLFHLPIAQYLAANCPWGASAWQTRLVILPGTLLAAFLLAELTERRKSWWTHLFAAAASAIRPERSPARL